MDFALFLSAVLLGLAGTPHCVAMCGGACAALGVTPGSGRGAQVWTFHVARVAGYALAGGVAAGSVGALSALAAWSPALRPLWTLVHAAAMGLGLYLLWRGQQPQWLEQLGRGRAPASTAVAGAEGWQRMRGPAKAAKAATAGALWVAWPCGLLQSALMVAALANHAAAGAAVMAGFGIASGLGLAMGPALWLWFMRSRSGAGAASAASANWQTASVRLAGAMLAGASMWALGHDLIKRVVAYCIS